MKITEIKLNPDNPRVIKDDKFAKLVNSLKELPIMLNKRPVLLDEDNIIIGGNMRFRAAKEAGMKEVPIEIFTKEDAKKNNIIAKELDSSYTDKTYEEQRQEMIIKDNVSGGEWNWNTLANEWDNVKLEEWGLNVWKAPTEVDYSILDGEDLTDQLLDMTNGVKKAIQIEFEAEHYEEAFALVKFWRDKKAYVGGMIMEYLKTEKEKI